MTRAPECDSCSDMPSGLADVAQELVVAGFAPLWDARALPPEDLLPAHAAAAGEAARTLSEQGRCELDDEGRLVGAHGLTLRPTRHRFVHEGQSRHTWCAFDAIGIPVTLGLEAVAHTDCPTCRRPITVESNAGIVAAGDVPVLWLPAPTGTNPIVEFCARANLYCSAGHLESQIDVLAASGEIVSVTAAAAAARDIWADTAAAMATNDSLR